MPKCIITENVVVNVPKYVIIKPPSNSKEEENEEKVFKPLETNQYLKNNLSGNECQSFCDLSCSFKSQKNNNSKYTSFEDSKLYYAVLINYLCILIYVETLFCLKYIQIIFLVYFKYI